MESKDMREMVPPYANMGYGPNFSVIDVGLDDLVCVIEPDTAFWALVDKKDIGESFSGDFLKQYQEKEKEIKEEMQFLRFGLTPSAVYFNPTERCNFNCSYCYIPEDMRKNGKHMTADEVVKALSHLSDYFEKTMGKDNSMPPQVIFHGSEPMMNKEAVFAGIDAFENRFAFGVQTNATLLDEEAISFLRNKNVGIGISLDAPVKEIADKTRKNWNGEGAFDAVIRVMDSLADYPAFNVITTVTKENVESLVDMVDFYHNHGVAAVMFNPVRLTRPGAREIKPDNAVLSKYFTMALDRIYELYEKTGKKLLVANFANIMAAITAPTGRRLMCDISPCGGGRCFFAMSARGDLFPCSEFIGMPEFNGGNMYEKDIADIINSEPFNQVTGRMIEKITPCSTCAIRHFCGAPCPAEVKSLTGRFDAPAPYCEFYQDQVRYAFKLIAQGREELYLWDTYKEETNEILNFSK